MVLTSIVCVVGSLRVGSIVNYIMKLLLRLSLLSPVFALAYATTLSLDLSDSSIQHDNDAPLTSVIVGNALAHVCMSSLDD